MRDVRHLMFIGFPNSGKSAFSDKVRAAHDCQFIDVDREFVVHFERERQVSHKVFVRENPDEYARLREAFLSKRAPELATLPPSVVSTPGAIIYHPQVMAAMRQCCLIVHLSCDFETLNARRPFETKGIQLGNARSYHELYEQRMPIYRAEADVTIEESGDIVRDFAKVEELIDARKLFARK